LRTNSKPDYLRGTLIDLENPTVRVESLGLDRVRLAPGASIRLEFYPRAKGRAEYACTIEGHREAGMRGVLEIR
jgi:uncharacterized cupredoxin-like copper-binding protein